MIKLYGGGTPNVFKVLIMLAETGLPYEFQRVNVAGQEQFSPEFTALNPNNKIPVIVDSDGPGGQAHTVFESGAILIYLAEKTGKFLPVDPVHRSKTLQWLMLQMASIGPMFGQALHFRYLVAGTGNEYAARRYLTEVLRLYGVLERQLKGNAYISGEEFTIADMAIYPWAAKYSKPLGVDLREFPGVSAWVARVEQRPGVVSVAKLAGEQFKMSLAAQKAADPDSLDRMYGRGRYAVSLEAVQKRPE